MPIRTLEDRRSLFVRKAKHVTDQAHFDAIMDSFPEEMRDALYDEVEPFLTKPFVYVPNGLGAPVEAVEEPEPTPVEESEPEANGIVVNPKHLPEHV